MATFNGLPLLKIKIDESLESNTGIDFVSLVDFPAIETNWVAFENHKKLFFSADKQLLAGPILIPDMPIYRFSEKMGEFYVKFEKDEIEKMVRKFQKTQKSINLNYQHQKDSQIQGAVIQEIWITSKQDKSNRFGFNLPEGSAFVIAHIPDAKFWEEEVKSGNVKGFSIEGFLDMELKNIEKMNNENKFVAATTTEGMTIQTDTETFAVGSVVYSLSETGEQVPVPDGTYTFDNGMTITVVGSAITEVSEAETPMTEQEMSAIKKVLKPILDAYDSKIAELEVTLKNITPAKSATEDSDEEEKKEVKTEMSAVQSALSKLNKIKKNK